MMRGDLHVEMLLLRLFVISVVLKATRVMPATVMRRSVSDATFYLPNLKPNSYKYHASLQGTSSTFIFIKHVII